MVAIVEKAKPPTKVLNALIELGLDSVQTYETAMSRIDDLDDKARFERLRSDHERQVVALQSLVRDQGGAPAAHPDVRYVIDKGKVVLASLVGDRLVLLAMKEIEADLVDGYDHALDHPQLSPEIRDALVRFRDEARSHVAELEERLISFDEVDVESFVPPNTSEVEPPAASRDDDVHSVP